LKGLGPTYFQFEVFCAAIAGEYDRADAAIAEHLRLSAVEQRLLPLIGHQFLRLAPIQNPRAALVQYILTDRQGDIATVLRQPVDWHMVRGILALERGDTLLATQSFQKALDLVGTIIYFPERPIAEHYLKLLRENQE